MIDVILLSLLLDLVNINFCEKVYQNIPNRLSYGLFSLFQNLQLVIVSTNDKCYLAISSGRSCQYQPSASVDFLGSCNLHFSFTVTDLFKIWISALHSV